MNFKIDRKHAIDVCVVRPGTRGRLIMGQYPYVGDVTDTAQLTQNPVQHSPHNSPDTVTLTRMRRRPASPPNQSVGWMDGYERVTTQWK